MFHQRMFNDGPPQDDRERLELSAFNRWWYETLVGPDPRLKRTNSRQVLTSVNRTFGYGAGDPRRIVKLEAPVDFATYDRNQLTRGDLLHPTVERRTAIVTEHGSFVRRGNGSIERMADGIANIGSGRMNRAHADTSRRSWSTGSSSTGTRPKRLAPSASTSGSV